MNVAVLITFQNCSHVRGWVAVSLVCCYTSSILCFCGRLKRSLLRLLRLYFVNKISVWDFIPHCMPYVRALQWAHLSVHGTQVFFTVKQCSARYWDCMSSVRASVCLCVTLVDQDRISWKFWKLSARTISPTPSLFVAQRPSTFHLLPGEHGEIKSGVLEAGAQKRQYLWNA